MTNYKVLLVIVSAAIVIAGGSYVYVTGSKQSAMPTDQQPSATQPVQEAVAPIEYPVTAPQTIADDAPMPSLDNSDASIRKSLGEIFDLKRYGEQLLLESVITRFVVIVDNLDRRNLPLRHMLTQPPKGKFLVVKAGEEKFTLDEHNFQRYEPFVSMLETMDVEAFVTLYARYYPLFQKAYEEMGYPNKYFNDRVVKIIDHLAFTPRVASGPIELTQSVVTYRYADPSLEKLSSGQKLMIRMGGNNAAKVKAKLQQFRQALTRFKRN